MRSCIVVYFQNMTYYIFEHWSLFLTFISFMSCLLENCWWQFIIISRMENYFIIIFCKERIMFCLEITSPGLRWMTMQPWNVCMFQIGCANLPRNTQFCKIPCSSKLYTPTFFFSQEYTPLRQYEDTTQEGPYV